MRLEKSLLVSEWDKRFLTFIAIKRRHTERFYLEAQIALLKSAKAADCLPANWINPNNTDADFNQGSVSLELVTKIIVSDDLALRSDGFTMVCESSKGTADFSAEELSLIKSCLKISIDTQVPSFGTSLYVIA